MKKYHYIFCIYSIFAQFHLFCDAGLMDLLMRRRHHIFSDNNNQISPIIQNYPSNNYNWRLPDALLKQRDRINNDNLYNGGSNDDSNNFSNNPLLNNQGVPFTNNFNDNRLPNSFVTNDGDLNNKPSNIDIDPNGNTPISNANSFQNNAKIMNDLNKINHIMDAIKKQNAENNRRKHNDGNHQTSNDNTNDSPTEPIGFTNIFPLVHVNKRHGVRTNVNNGYQNGGDNGVSSPYISNKPPNNNDYNTATTSPIITNPPNDTPMTNVSPSENISNGINNYNGNTHHTKPIISHPPRHGRGNTSLESPNASSSNTEDKKHERDDKYLLKPITKRKFFFQVKPVVPDYKTVSNNETIYYVN